MFKMFFKKRRLNQQFKSLYKILSMFGIEILDKTDKSFTIHIQDKINLHIDNEMNIVLDEPKAKVPLTFKEGDIMENIIGLVNMLKNSKDVDIKSLKNIQTKSVETNEPKVIKRPRRKYTIVGGKLPVAPADKTIVSILMNHKDGLRVHELQEELKKFGFDYTLCNIRFRVYQMMRNNVGKIQSERGIYTTAFEVLPKRINNEVDKLLRVTNKIKDSKLTSLQKTIQSILVQNGPLSLNDLMTHINKVDPTYRNMKSVRVAVGIMRNNQLGNLAKTEENTYYIDTSGV